MASTALKITIVGLLSFGCSLASSAAARGPSRGITISLRRVSTLPPGEIVCLGSCFQGRNLDVTVWADGRVEVDHKPHSPVSKHGLAKFRSILLPFRPVGEHAYTDPSAVLPNTCPVKVQWPADHFGRPRACGFYGSNGVQGPLIGAVTQALQLIDPSLPTP